MSKPLSKKQQQSQAIPALEGHQIKPYVTGEGASESDERYRRLMEAASDAGCGIVMMQNVGGKEGVITYVNASLIGALGYTGDEVLGMTLTELIAPESLATVLERYRLRQEGKPVPQCYEILGLRRDGGTIPLEVSGAVTTIDGKPATLAFVRDVSERKRMEAALRETDRLYRLLAENVSDVLWVTDMDFSFTYISPSASALIGFPMEEIMQMTVEQMLTPESYDRGLKVFAEQMEIERSDDKNLSRHWTLEVEMICKDGSTVWAEERVQFLRDDEGTPIGLLGITRDITERRRAEEALRQSEEEYRTLVESSPDGVLCMDSRGRIIDCNEALCRLLKYDRNDLRGRKVRDLVVSLEDDSLSNYCGRLKRSGIVEGEFEYIRGDKERVPIWAKEVKLSKATNLGIRAFVYLRDITEKRKVDQLKDEFISLVSHELRTPLTVIIGAIDTAMKEGSHLTESELWKLLQDAATESQSLSHILSNLLELSRVQANRLRLDIEPVQIGRTVRKVVNSLCDASSRHKLVIDIPRRLPRLHADELRLERILHNLVENAMKYSPGGEIVISAKRDGDCLTISVADQGPGISAEDQAALFQPFRRVAIDHATRGTGLGLLVCKRLVEAHGGSIWVESRPGEGSTFSFSLPL